jgi:hypothetical protein
VNILIHSSIHFVTILSHFYWNKLQIFYLLILLYIAIQVDFWKEQAWKWALLSASKLHLWSPLLKEESNTRSVTSLLFNFFSLTILHLHSFGSFLFYRFAIYHLFIFLC